MKPMTGGGGILQRCAASPLVNEVELRGVISAAAALASQSKREEEKQKENKEREKKKWQVVQLLTSAAQCTLAAGRGSLALPLIEFAIELSPNPFCRLRSLQSENIKDESVGCTILQFIEELQESDREAIACICTAIVVWHGAVASTTVSDNSSYKFLRFSHKIGHIITVVASSLTLKSSINNSVIESLSTCWLYNTLAFAQRCKEILPIGFYLLEELHENIQPLDLCIISENKLVCSPGMNTCVRLGLRGPQVAAMWHRLCFRLYTEGCLQLQSAQEGVCRSASIVKDILQQAFKSEGTHYLVNFRRSIELSDSDLTVLRDVVSGVDLCIPRETFASLRLACFLIRISVKYSCLTRFNYPITSVSSVVSLAQRHRYTDIAVEIVQAKLTVEKITDKSLLIWGEELVFFLDGKVHPAALSSFVVNSVVYQTSGKPKLLLHDASKGMCAIDILRTFIISDNLEELLLVGLKIIRDDSSTLGRQLFEDKIAPIFILDGLVRLIIRLVHEGDLPLARCFLPVVVGISVRMPSQANFIIALNAITKFAQYCPDDLKRWENIANTLLTLLPPLPPSLVEMPLYYKTKLKLTGRTFSTRRQIFNNLYDDTPKVTNFNASYSQIQVIITCNQEKVRLFRSSSSSSSNSNSSNSTTTTTTNNNNDTTEEGKWWKKELPIGLVMQELVCRMREIEKKNREQLNATSHDKNSESAGIYSSKEEVNVENELIEHIDKERDYWWEQRYALDSAIREVVEVMQSDNAFGCWRVAMCGDLPPLCLLEIHEVAIELLQTLGASMQYINDLELILSGLPFLGTFSSFEKGLMFNFIHVETEGLCESCEEVLTDLSNALESELLKHIIFTSLSENNFSNSEFTVFRRACLRTLKAICIANFGFQKNYKQSEHVDLFRIPRTPVYLILDNEFHCLPFEGIDAIRNGSIARIPTVKYISSFRKERLFFKDTIIYCMIDPNGVMPKTSKRLIPLCKRNGWQINSQKLPPGKLIEELYSSRAQLYVYVGHGKGESLLNREELYERFPDLENFPAVFLMGCSSAYMDGGSSYDCYGMPYAFLHAGCPLFVGCLWHVTDGEIDRLTKRLLSLIAGKNSDDNSLSDVETVGDALMLARRSCKLPFLTGCATVLYGMNLPIAK